MGDHRIVPADGDLDSLIDALHGRAAAAAPRPAQHTTGTLDAWLAAVRELDGSDLLLVAGRPPMVRTGDRFHAANVEVLDSDDIVAAVRDLLPATAAGRYEAGAAVDAAFTRPGLGRFRLNLHRERGRAAVAIRALPMRVPELPALRFSHDVARLSQLPRGLVLIGGPTGSGKTTTLAALVSLINAREARHIITIEDPIEYEHAHGQSVIEQIEVGIDVADFPTALRAAMRQAPDVLVIGEMRDPETMRIALAAAETGHLVLATVHATDAGAAVSRITDAFPTERQNAVRQELAMSLAAVLTQTLVPAADSTRIPIAELLVVSYGARQHIRKNALQHLNQEVTMTRKLGSFTFEESLARSVRAGLLAAEDARLRAHHPEEFDSLLNSSF
ncbi:MAG: type IV pilus twitching motility protein PilT [Vicinamibacterales bacterium]